MTPTQPSMSVLVLCMHYPGRAPNQRFRIEQYADYLAQQGVQLEFSYLLNEKEDRIFYSPGHFFKKLGIVWRSLQKRKADVRRAKQFDAVLIIRESLFVGPAFIEKRLKKTGVPLYYDFDDAIWRLDVSRSNRWFGFLKFPAKTSSIIRLADVVIAGNQYLADYALQFNSAVKIIPTTVDTDSFTPAEKKQDSITIGWSGSLTTTKHFDTAVPVLLRLKEKYGDRLSFKLIGNSAYYNKTLNLQGEAWSAATEVEELRKIDIGIMPLPDDEWSKGKCGLKGLVYMSLGIPAVMSPVGVNREIIRHGENGCLAAGPEEWFASLCELIENEELRKKMGEEGRKTVIEKFSVASQRAHYLQLFRPKP